MCDKIIVEAVHNVTFIPPPLPLYNKNPHLIKLTSDSAQLLYHSTTMENQDTSSFHLLREQTTVLHLILILIQFVGPLAQASTAGVPSSHLCHSMWVSWW